MRRQQTSLQVQWRGEKAGPWGLFKSLMYPPAHVQHNFLQEFWGYNFAFKISWPGAHIPPPIGLLLWSPWRPRGKSFRGSLKGSLPRTANNYKRTNTGDFPGGLVVRTPCFQYRGRRFDPWLGN